MKKFKKNLFFILLQINNFLMFSDHFDMLMFKIIFKKIKKIILICFEMKNTLKGKKFPSMNIFLPNHPSIHVTITKKYNEKFSIFFKDNLVI